VASAPDHPPQTTSPARQTQRIARTRLSRGVGDSNAAKSMQGREFHYRWVWQLKSPPEALWSYVADTQRFNRDADVPAIIQLDQLAGSRQPIINNRRLLKMHRIKLGPIKLIPIEWHENPFEWIKPKRFGVLREYINGPMYYMRTLTHLNAKPDGGTEAIYEVWAYPRNPLWALAVILQIGILSAHQFRAVFNRYDEMAQRRQTFDVTLYKPHLAPGGVARLSILRETLLKRGVELGILDKLIDLIVRGDDLTLMRIRPYALADAWGVPRKMVLELFLHATRVGLLDFRWELLCPLCRGAKASALHLNDLIERVHCDVCNIDYDVNFDQSVELVFTPNSSVRKVELADYCIGGPQITPHILTQALIKVGEHFNFPLPSQPGRYRIRTMLLKGGASVLVDDDAPPTRALKITDEGWGREELIFAPNSALTVENATSADQLFILERIEWSDQAVTAAEVTSRQLFRDLFANEALRPGNQISVGNLTLLFTDLRESTTLYRDIGDAPAFGLVMSHFDVLREIIDSEDGAIVKTNGDASMVVFRRPVNAVRAAVRIQRAIANRKLLPTLHLPLAIKIGIHAGSCITVNLNDRLDYFGSTVNIAARLESLSTGDDIVLSSSVYLDPEVVEYLKQDATLGIQAFTATLKGFGGKDFELWRLTTANASVSTRDQ